MITERRFSIACILSGGDAVEYPSMAYDSSFISFTIQSTGVTSVIGMEWCLNLMVSVNVTTFLICYHFETATMIQRWANITRIQSVKYPRSATDGFEIKRGIWSLMAPLALHQRIKCLPALQTMRVLYFGYMAASCSICGCFDL